MSRLLVPPQRRKLRPMAGRRNKEARERALLENRDVSDLYTVEVILVHVCVFTALGQSLVRDTYMTLYIHGWAALN